MEKNAEKNLEKNKIFDNKVIYIILAVIIFFQVGLVTWRFIFEKEGFHSDESWSYGFANYFYRPTTSPEKFSSIGNSDQINRWIDGYLLTDFLTSQEDERFSYGDVWYTQAHDYHPPLYYSLMHMVCSFFPNRFSWWFAYAINLAAMIVGQIFFYKAASEMCRSKPLGLLAMIMWGFSYGFTNLNIFLRMYSILVMFAIMFIYYNSRLYYNKGIARDNLIKLGIVTLCGALTHHFFLPAAFGIAAGFCFLYLFKKQFKMLFSYAASVGGAVILSFIIFPAAFDHLFTQSRYSLSAETINENSSTFLNELLFCYNTSLNRISGIPVSAYLTGKYSFLVAAVVILAAIAVPLSFLFRKEEWFKAFVGKIKSSILYFFRNFDFIFLFTIISCLIVMYAVAKTVDIHRMREHTDRYLFVVMPWVALCMLLAAKYIIQIITQIIRPLKKFSTAIVAVLVCASVLFSNILTPRHYFFERNIQGEGGMETTVSDSSNYIVMLTNTWHMVLFPEKLIGCNNIFFTLFNQYDFYKDEIRKIDPENCYVIMPSSVMTSYYESYETLESLNESEDNEQNDPALLYSTEITSIEDIFTDFETNIFPGYKLQFYSSEEIMGVVNKTYKLVPESEYEYIYGTDAPIS